MHHTLNFGFRPNMPPNFTHVPVYVCSLLFFGLFTTTLLAEDGALPTALSLLDAGKTTQAQEALLALSADEQPALLRTFRTAWKSETARLLAKVLDRRRHQFSSVEEVPPVLQKEIFAKFSEMLLTSEENFERILMSLNELGNVQAPFLKNALNERGNSRTGRLRIARALAQFKRPEALPVLIEAMASDEQTLIVRADLIAYREEAAAHLIQLGLLNANPVIRRRSADLLGWMGTRLGGTDLPARLMVLVEDKVAEVAVAALLALANLKEKSSVKPLLLFAQRSNLADLNLIHATAIALAGSVTPDDLAAVIQLTQGTRRQQKEIGLIVLGLWPHAVNDGEQARLIGLLQRHLTDSTSILQRRAIQSLGAWANRNSQEALQAIAKNGTRILSGRQEVRYPGALALGEYAAMGQHLPEHLRTQSELILNVKPVEQAADTCQLALLCFVEPRGGAVDGFGNVNGSTSEGSGVEDSSPSKPPVQTQPEGKSGDSSVESSSKAEGQQEVGFKWKSENKPLTEYKTREQHESGTESTAKPSTSTNDAAANQPQEQAVTNTNKPEDASPSDTDESDEKETSKKKPLDDTEMDALGKPGGLNKRRSKVSCDLPLLKRNELVEIDNPVHPGISVYAGYTRAN